MSGPGSQTPARMEAQAADKGDLAHAYVEAVQGQAPMSEYTARSKTYRQIWGARAEPATAPAARPRNGRAAARPDDLNVYLPWFGQTKSFYCGPASGKMILNSLREGTSAYNGAPQDQPHIAGPAHMRTEMNGKTGWDTGLFRVGINRWRQGTNDGYFVDKANPSPDYFRDALLYDTYTGRPFGADTVETRGQVPYNHHPLGTTAIGHWIVAYGYIDNGARTRFADPAADMWEEHGVDKYFHVATTPFVNAYLNNNGITW